MNKLILTIFMAIIIASPANAEQDFSFGTGLGYAYSGLGVNVAIRDHHSMKYIGGGMSNYSSEDGVGYGISLGWIRTDLLDPCCGRHGVGVDLQFSTIDGSSNYFSMGPTYTYFFNGISNPGFNIGFVTGIGFEANPNSFIVFPQIGYQF